MTSKIRKSAPGPETAAPAEHVEKKDQPRTWGERNGGKILGLATFGLLSLATFLMWLANRV